MFLHEKSASKEILGLFRNPKIHYRIHNSQPLVRVLSYKNVILTFLSYSFNIHFNIISSKATSSKYFFLQLTFS